MSLPPFEQFDQVTRPSRNRIDTDVSHLRKVVNSYRSLCESLYQASNAFMEERDEALARLAYPELDGPTSAEMWAKHDELRARAEKAEAERDEAVAKAKRHEAHHEREHTVLAAIVDKWDRSGYGMIPEDFIDSARAVLNTVGGDQ